MRKIVLPLTVVAVAAFSLPAIPAQALVARTFISAAGSDSNNCANVVTPCRHLATAYAATAPNGEIYVLDPANYGSLTITGPVSIEGHGWASIAPPGTGTAAITINANPGDKINIIGVVLDGTALANATGIQFNSGGSLVVRDSVIRNFSLEGINFVPSASSNLYVSDTLLADNSSVSGGGGGIQINPTGSGDVVTAVLNRVEAINNAAGIGIGIFGPGTTGGNITVSVSESNISGNASGIANSSSGGQAVSKVTLYHSVVANNSTNGIWAIGGTATFTVAQSAVTGNTGAGWNIVSNAVIETYQDNYFNDNGANVGTLTNVGKQ